MVLVSAAASLAMLVSGRVLLPPHGEDVRGYGVDASTQDSDAAVSEPLPAAWQGASPQSLRLCATSEQSMPHALIIAEVAQAHDGSLGAAHAYIDAAARAGADAVKFQTHIAAAESSPAEPWRVKFSLQDATRYDYWRRMEFTEEQWAGLRMHADERGLQFLSSPFSVEAAQLLRRVGVSAWKIASGEVNNVPLFDFMLSTGLPGAAFDRA